MHGSDMKKNLYMYGTVALAFTMSGLPMFALAESEGVEAPEPARTAAIAVPMGGQAVPANTSVRARAVPNERAGEALKQREERAREMNAEREREGGMAASSTDRTISNEQAREAKKQQMEQIRVQLKQDSEQVRETYKNLIELAREGTTTVRDAEELKQAIEERRQLIKESLASTSPVRAQVLERAVKVSVAVHALLSARDLLGGPLGEQVGQIARQVNDSLATTTSAETQIESRGFFSKLLFGGDTKAAEAIRKQVAQNQERIQSLASLLSEASTTPDVKATLETQIQAMQDEQARLEKVAETQSKLWGLFSWRF